jgi:hypothetical protein
MNCENRTLIVVLTLSFSIWLLDLARCLPKSVRLDGFDIDISQSPPAHWLPPNVNVRTWDMFQDVPIDFVGKFDIVHVRLIGLVIKNNNPLPAIYSLHKLLSSIPCF